MALQSILSILTAAVATHIALGGEIYAAFDAAVASSTYVPGDFAAARAMAPGSGYWCSSGVHTTSQVVTWTGKSHSRHTAIGVKINWEYAPGEFKLMISSDGGNFAEAACWRKPNGKDASHAEFVMFDTPQPVTALSMAMRKPMPWNYYGIADVTLIVEPYAFMLINGAQSSSGELCLVAQGSGLGTEPCLKAVASGDGREIFRMNDGQIVAAGSSKCMTLVNGDVSNGGKLALETCTTAAGADDGRSSWTMTSAGQMKLASVGNYCLDVSAQGPAVYECVDESVTGGDRFTIVAVPEFDGKASVATQSSASLLKASARRQSSLLAKLQDALSHACALPKSLTNFNMTTALVALPKPALAATRATDPAMKAIEYIYGAQDVDMSSLQQLIVDTAAALKMAGERA